MSRNRHRYRKQQKSPVKIFAVVLLLVLVMAAFIMLVLPQILYRLSGDADTQQTETSDSVVSEETGEDTEQGEVYIDGEAVAFPVSLENDRLEIESMYQYSGINPDCENAEGNNTAAITLHNVSSEYLKEAEISMTLQDGTALEFKITDLPAGESVIAFSTENTELGADAVCVQVGCEAVFEEPDSTAEKVSAEAEGMLITVVNTSGEDLSEIVIYCRGVFGEDYFGGVTYQYTINNLPAGESTQVDAFECIMGEAEVVRVAVN